MVMFSTSPPTTLAPTTLPPTAAYPWRAVSYNGFVYMSNGVVAIKRNPNSGLWEVANDLPVATGICDYNGQIVIGAPGVLRSRPTTVAADPTDILAYWKLTEVAGPRLDSTGNGLDLTPEMGVISFAADGKFGTNCLAFNASEALSSQLVAYTDVAIQQPGAFAAHFWFKGASTIHGSKIIDMRIQNYRIYVDYRSESPGKLRVVVESGSWVEGHYYTSPSDAMDQDQWHFLALTCDEVNYALYLDGVQLCNNPVPWGILFAGYLEWGDYLGFYFTSNVGGEGNTWSKVSEAAVWKRGLSEAEILDLYNAGAGRELY